MENEIWKEIPGYNGVYFVSNLGRFKTIDRIIPHNGISKKQFRKGKILKQSFESNGYLQVRLQCPKQKIFSSHRLIAQVFIQNSENKPFVNHIDGIKHNNLPENLEWVTRSENCIHSFKIGLQCNKGENHPIHKLTNEQIVEIRNKYTPYKYSSYKLAKEYGVSRVTINDIVKKRTWNHI